MDRTRVRTKAFVLAAGIFTSNCSPLYYYQHPDHPHTHFLRAGEFVVPDEVLAAYLVTVEGMYVQDSVGGVYLDEDNLGKKIGEFQDELRGRGFTTLETDVYTYIMRTPKHIVLSPRHFFSTSFKKSLAHERFHREQFLLHPQDQETLRQTYVNLINRRVGIEEAIQVSEYNVECAVDHQRREIPLVRDRTEVCWPRDESPYRTIAVNSWIEFYPYLAQGVYVPSVERMLQEEFPKAFSIYDRIRRKTTITE